MSRKVSERTVQKMCQALAREVVGDEGERKLEWDAVRSLALALACDRKMRQQFDKIIDFFDNKYFSE